MAFISKQRIKQILDQAPLGTDKSKLLDDLIARGHTIEGLNSPPTQFSEALKSQPAETFVEGLTTNRPTEGIASTIGRTALPLAGSIIGAGAGGGVASIPTAAAGGAAGESIRQAIVSAADPSRQRDIGEVAGKVGREGLLQGAAQGIGLGINKLLGRIAPSVYDYMATSKIFGGIAKRDWDFFKNNLSKTAARAKAGIGPEAEDEIANDIRTHISNAEQRLEEKYRQGAIALSKSKNPIKIDLQKNLGDVYLNIGKEAGYMDPVRNANTPQAQVFFNKVINRVNNMKGASPHDIYLFQKDLNAAISDNIHVNPSLAKPLLEAKDATRLFIEDHPQLKSIADLNAAWTTAKNIASDSRKLVKSNDLIAYVKRVLGNERDTLAKRPLENISRQLPEVGKGFEDIKALSAAKSVAPLLRDYPATGLGGAALLLGAKYLPAVAREPAYALAAPAVLSQSPRAYALGYRGAMSLSGSPFLTSPTLATLAALRKLRERQDQP